MPDNLDPLIFPEEMEVWFAITLMAISFSCNANKQARLLLSLKIYDYNHNYHSKSATVRQD